MAPPTTYHNEAIEDSRPFSEISRGHDIQRYSQPKNAPDETGDFHVMAFERR